MGSGLRINRKHSQEDVGDTTLDFPFRTPRREAMQSPAHIEGQTQKKLPLAHFCGLSASPPAPAAPFAGLSTLPSKYTTSRIPAWIKIFAHSLQGYSVTYTFAPFSDEQFLFITAFISAWQTYGYFVARTSPSDAALACGVRWGACLFSRAEEEEEEASRGRGRSCAQFVLLFPGLHAPRGGRRRRSRAGTRCTRCLHRARGWDQVRNNAGAAHTTLNVGLLHRAGEGEIYEAGHAPRITFSVFTMHAPTCSIATPHRVLFWRR